MVNPVMVAFSIASAFSKMSNSNTHAVVETSILRRLVRASEQRRYTLSQNFPDSAAFEDEQHITKCRWPRFVGSSCQGVRQASMIHENPYRNCPKFARCRARAPNTVPRGPCVVDSFFVVIFFVMPAQHIYGPQSLSDSFGCFRRHRPPAPPPATRLRCRFNKKFPKLELIQRNRCRGTRNDMEVLFAGSF
jgi:hypothetical protein